VIPLRDVQKRPGIPVVTALIVAANVAVWIYMLTLVENYSALYAFFDRWAFHAFAFFSAVSDRQLTLETATPLLTHQFVHAGWLHIAGNMLFLWVFGAAVEQRIGRVRFLIFYLVAGCVAALAQGIYQILSFQFGGGLVGASGAISGVLGAYLVLTPMARVRAIVPIGLFMTPITLPAILLLGEWFALQIVAIVQVLRVVGDTAEVAYFAHVGGFVFGVVLLGAGRIAERLYRFRAQPA
jgi:membrane associated rhomboid family serine protease